VFRSLGLNSDKSQGQPGLHRILSGACIRLQLELILYQERQCTYNVQSKRARATIDAVDKQKVLHILSVCL